MGDAAGGAMKALVLLMLHVQMSNSNRFMVRGSRGTINAGCHAELNKFARLLVPYMPLA